MAVICVNIGECKIARAPDTLVTHSLGSCVGVAIWDPSTKTGGLAHIMLPGSKIANGLTPAAAHGNPCKYADVAVTQLFDELIKSGASGTELRAKIVGGACMFAGACRLSEQMKIGDKNIEAARSALAALRIPILAEDVGGHRGKTVELLTETGVLVVKSAFRDVKEI